MPNRGGSKSTSPGPKVDPGNLVRAKQQLEEGSITLDDIKKIWGEGLIGSLLRQHLDIMKSLKPSQKRRRKDSDGDFGFEDEEQGGQRKRQWKDDQQGSRGKQRRSDYDSGDNRGWNAKVQPRSKGGQFKKMGEEDELSGEEEGNRGQQRRHRRSRSRSVDSTGNRGSAARFLPRTETGQFKKKGEHDDLRDRHEEEEDSDSGGGHVGRPRRRRDSQDLPEEYKNRHGNFRGWNAKAQSRRGFSEDEDDGGHGQSRRRRSRSRSVDSTGNRGSAARFLPRTETGQFKKKGEHDDLRDRHEEEEEDSDSDGGHPRRRKVQRRQTGKFGKSKDHGDEEEEEEEEEEDGGNGRGTPAKTLPRTETGQLKKRGEKDELGERHKAERAHNRSGPNRGKNQNSGSFARSNTNENEAEHEPGWNAKYQPRDPETGQFKPSSGQKQAKVQESQNRQKRESREGMDTGQQGDGRRQEAIKTEGKNMPE